MFTVTKYPHGAFSWADNVSLDQAAVKTFYVALMGWEAEDLPLPGDMGVYTMFRKDGHNVAGLGAMPPEMREHGMPSVWNSYVNVDSVDALVPRITELGGTVMGEPMDVMDSGRLLLFSDPTGAVVGAWQPDQHIGAGLVNTVGAMCWNELATRNPETAMAFYSGLFGWVFSKTEGMDYWSFTNNGRMNGGVVKMTAEWGEMPPHWMTYFTVADLDTAMTEAIILGGRVLNGPIESQGVGRFAVIHDPAGAVCTIIQLERPDPWGE